jgi:uncharacterized protein (TIGR03435 family)
MKRVLAGISLFALLSLAIFGQSPARPPTFDIADVHTSAHSTFPFMDGGTLRGDRYVVRNATMVDLIAAAYDVDGDKVLSGPSWLDTDRYDVIAKAAPKTPPETVRLMLQTLLADRFELVLHTDSKPMPVFVLSVGKAGKPKLKEADPAGATGCQPPPNQPQPTPGTIFYISMSCKNMSMEVFAQQIHQMAGGYLANPVVDQTELKGSWDFDFKWSPKGLLAQSGADGISIFDAMDKQLGLKLEAQKVAMPVYMVDSVNEKPTANPPEVVTKLPPPPPAEFEVAIIKPSAPDEVPTGGGISGNQINIQLITVKQLISIAWDLNPNDSDSLVGAPKWLDSDKYDIIAKVSSDAPVNTGGRGPGNGLPADIDDLRKMLRALLEDRFKLKTHMEDRPVSAYTLTAANPKMKQADPINRTGCKEGPGPDGKDPRITNPILGRLLTCQNITMAQFAEKLQSLAPGYIYTPVLDQTGLDGAYDFTLSFSGAGAGLGPGGGGRGGDASTAAAGSAMAPDPSGAISLFDAINKQLGLKLQKEKRPVPVLVIDHIEEKPTDN